MKIIDKKFLSNKLSYLLQSVLAGVAMMLILAVFNTISNGAIVAALGASTFIVFVLPGTRSARPRYLIGGYVMGIVIGVLCYWLKIVAGLPEQLGAVSGIPCIVFGASAVGLATFVMVITNTEHPPAAGIALGFVMLGNLSWPVPAGVLAAILVLCLVKQASRT